MISGVLVAQVGKPLAGFVTVRRKWASASRSPSFRRTHASLPRTATSTMRREQRAGMATTGAPWRGMLMPIVRSRALRAHGERHLVDGQVLAGERHCCTVE